METYQEKLEVKSVDWHLLENGRAHHTDRYEILHEESAPVLRRAQPFRISFTFNRPFNETTDRLRLLFSHEKKKPQPRLEAVLENTTVTSSNKINSSSTLWSLQLESQHKDTITLLVRSPPIAAWGLWDVTLKISHKLHPKVTSWKCPTQFWLLFNPWMKDDDVYMQDTKLLDEYILNDVGKIYTSSSKKPIGMKWIYGQFAAPVLKVVKKILDNEELTESQLGSPVKLSKAVARTRMTILGNWGGNFDGGTPPWLWTGSLPIYEEFYKTGKPAKWAQCFVYAGVFTTALRAVGIPSRNVTNFVSSTSGDDTMCINYVYDSNGEALKSPDIWNFHVWNDAWMARNDLPDGYGGWQAMDSAGMGPAPVEAIKKGEVCLNYDAKIIMAECNADRVRWTVDSEGEYHLVKVDTAYMGRAMLTKQPFVYDPHGDTDFQDISHLYKLPEGSKEERLALLNAVKYCKKEHKEYMESVEPFLTSEEMLSYSVRFHMDVPETDDTVKFELEEIESVIFGNQFFAVLKVENVGETAVTVEACLGSSSICYNGAVVGLIKREYKSINIKPKSVGTMSVLVKPEEYAAKLVEFTLLKVHCIATVKENNFTWADDFQFNIEMPEIIISTKKDLVLNQEGILLFQIKNLLNTKLSKCSITYEAPGIGRNIKISVRDIKAGEDALIEHKVIPVKSGQIEIKAWFCSKELTFLGGSAELDVN